MREDPDREVLLRCSSADPRIREQAFETLHARHAERVYRLAYRLAGNDAEARDIVQEAFLRAFRRIHRFRRQSAFTSWLHRITVNIGIDRMRHARRRPAVPLAEDAPGADRLPGRPEEVGPEAAAARRELSERIRRVVATLSPRLAAVVLLRYGEGLSYAEVGEALGLPVGTVKSRLNRAHELLEPHLRDLRIDSP